MNHRDYGSTMAMLVRAPASSNYGAADPSDFGPTSGATPFSHLAGQAQPSSGIFAVPGALNSTSGAGYQSSGPSLISAFGQSSPMSPAMAALLGAPAGQYMKPSYGEGDAQPSDGPSKSDLELYLSGDYRAAQAPQSYYGGQSYADQLDNGMIANPLARWGNRPIGL